MTTARSGRARAPTVPRQPAATEAVPPLATDLAGRVFAVKEGGTFVYSSTRGDLDDSREYGHGLYYHDTRYLSRYVLSLSGTSPVLLSSSAARAYMASVDLTNAELREPEVPPVPQQSLNIRRLRVVKGAMLERIRVRNFNDDPVRVSLELSLGADFADIFEVRGLQDAERGHPEEPLVHEAGAEFAYRGVDGVIRRTHVVFDPAPARLRVQGRRIEASIPLRLDGHESVAVMVTVTPVEGDESPSPVDFDAAVHGLGRSYQEWDLGSTGIVTNNELFNQLLERGRRDLRALYTETPDGGVISAGIPWYVATFGRDALIAAHQMLMVNPTPARQALRFLAAHQGTEVDDWRDEEPGKILHEIREGELARSGQIPHSPYYGSVDATPLFLLLYVQYLRWTGDLQFGRELLPNAEAALRWIDEYGDLDGDGFVEYQSRSPRGITNQGWKDSINAIAHRDGTLARGPIAMAEVQGYVYLAKQRMVEVYEELGDLASADRLRREALELRLRFQQAFWMPEDEYFAAALDGDKRQVATVMSNPGQCLYCDIVDQEKAEGVARRLLQPDLFSGWGIRTLSKSELVYNPMSYHNGSVWPHDNALIAAGLKRYGFVQATNRVATAIFDAAIHTADMRLPELFCGFPRRARVEPVHYPVACSPQAWAAGAPFLMLQAMLGISARAHQKLLTVNEPHLPPWLREVELRNLRVGTGSLSLVFRRTGEVTSFSVLERRGDVRVVMEG